MPQKNIMNKIILLSIISIAFAAMHSMEDNQNNIGWTPLHKAVNNENVDEVRKLLVQGANVNATTEVEFGYEVFVRIAVGDFNDDSTPLHKVTKDGNVALLITLLESGENVNATNQYGETPLHIATQYGNFSIAKLLLKYGGDVNNKNDRLYVEPPFVYTFSSGPGGCYKENNT